MQGVWGVRFFFYFFRGGGGGVRVDSEKYRKLLYRLGVILHRLEVFLFYFDCGLTSR